MLQAMRKHAKYFYVLFVIVIITFVFWGVGSVDKTGGVEIMAEVGPYKITAQDYWKTYDGVYRFYKEIYKDKFDEELQKKMNLKENVLDSMVSDKVLLIAAKKVGITVSNDELQDSISTEPAFMKDGVFNRDVYLNRLKLNRITPEVFENLKRQELTLEKMKRFIELSADTTDIDMNLQKISGNTQTADMIKQAMLGDKKGKAVQAYVEGMKKNIKITINKRLIS
jgi:SurA-like N-terminal domain